MNLTKAATEILGHDEFYIKAGIVHLDTTDAPVELETQTRIEEAAQPTDEDILEEKRQEIITRAAERRAEVAGVTDIYQIASWSNKAERARRIMAGTASEEDRQALQLETDKRALGETLEELAQKQLLKEALLAQAIATIDGEEKAALMELEANNE